MKKRMLQSIYVLSLATALGMVGSSTVHLESSGFRIGNQSVFAAGVSEESKDFKEDTKKAEEWGKEKEAEWKLSTSEKTTLGNFIADKEALRTNYESFSFSKLGTTADPDLAKKYKAIEDIINKAKLSEGVETYKTVEPSEIGFEKNLISGNTLEASAVEDFKEQYLNKTIKFDGYFDTALTTQTPTSKERVILKVSIPSAKGQEKPTKAGVFLSGKEYRMLVGNDYVLRVNDVSKVNIKGFQCLQVEGTMEKSLDFKNDLNSDGGSWARKNYGEWAKELSEEQTSAIENYGNRGYTAINNYLRNDGKESDGNKNEDLEEKIKNISEALARNPIPENITLYRWPGAKEFGYEIGKIPAIDAFKADVLGTEKEQKGFMSTSFSSARFNEGTIVLRLQVPKGTKGAFLNAVGGFQSENEMLLDKGYKYHIDKVTQVKIDNKNRYVVDATLLGN